MTTRERTARKLSAGQALLAARMGAGMSRAEVAAAVGCKEAAVRQWEDDERSHALPLADVAALPRPMAIAMMDWAAGRLELEVSPRLSHDSVDDDLECLARVTEQAGEVVAHLVRASMDGVLDRAEARAAKSMTQRLRRDVVALDNRVDAVMADGGAPVLRKVGGA